MPSHVKRLGRRGGLVRGLAMTAHGVLIVVCQSGYTCFHHGMTTQQQRLVRRIIPDLKGSGLLLLATVWAVLGLSVIVDGEPIVSGAWHQNAPRVLRVAWWAIPAVIAAVAAYRPCLRGWSVAALVIGPGLRSLSYFTSWVLAEIPGDPEGNPRGWVASALYALMVGFVLFVAAIDKAPPTMHDLADVLTDKTTEDHA